MKNLIENCDENHISNTKSSDNVTENIKHLESEGITINDSIKILGDISIYNETLRDFINVIDDKLIEINKYRLLEDMNNYAILVHSLKSDSRYLGFTELAKIAYDHEINSKNNNIEYIKTHHIDLVREVNRVIDITKKYLQ